MLKSLHVKNLAVIENEEILFGNGLNILTGETGAGKSVFMNSVNLALGEKADKSLIRNGCESALIEMAFEIENEEICNLLAQEDIYPEDDELLIGRRIAEHRSTARINGESVSASVLGFTAGYMLAIHGQQDTQILLRENNHIELLDAYGGMELKPAKEQVQAAYRAYEASLRELKDNEMDTASLLRARELAEHEVREINECDPRPGEDSELENLFRKLTNAHRIMESSGNAHDLINGESGAMDLLGRALQELSRAAQYDSMADDLADRLAELEGMLQDTAHDIGKYVDSLDVSEEQLEEVSNRLDRINRLKSKYGTSIEDVLSYRDERLNELARLDNYEAYRMELEKETEALRNDLSEKASVLTDIRSVCAAAMQSDITEHLRELNFAEAAFEVHVDPRTVIQSDGADNIEFCASLNPGQPVRSISKAASGGELSRIMLAIRTALAEKDQIPTLIFDEIDSGISGRTAAMVGRKLKQISKHRQVICITHLAQIAAFADHHFVIEKSVTENETKTRIHEADEEESILEIARLLGDEHLSGAALMNARQLKASAVI